MKTSFYRSFARDLKKIRDAKVLARIQETITAVESAAHLLEVNEAKKLAGTAASFRIRVGNHRVGVVVDKKGNAYFVRCLDRADFYKYFPG